MGLPFQSRYVRYLLSAAPLGLAGAVVLFALYGQLRRAEAVLATMAVVLALMLSFMVFVYYRAVDSHRRVELALRAKEQRLRLLIDQVPAVIWTTDQNLRVTSVLGSALAGLEVQPDDLVNVEMQEYFRLNNPESTPLAAPCRASGGEVLNYERCLANRTFQCHAEPIHEEDGTISGIIGVAVDISKRKESERVLEETNHRLEQAVSELRESQLQLIAQERLNALGELASTVAHDLNNALLPVIGYTEALLTDPTLAAPTRESVALVLSAAQDAISIVKRLKEFGRPLRCPPYQVVNLREIVSKIPDLMRPKWHDEALRTGRVIEFVLDAEDVAPVRGSAVELREVLTNLIINSVDAMPVGGRITIRLRQHNENVFVEVDDTGVGMDHETKMRCCEPFFTTKGIAGNGLGLGICQNIVKRHNGRIEIDSELGRGTTVRICLPVANDGEMLSAPLEKLCIHRILVIDDDPQSRCAVTLQLQRLGQNVDVAEGGTEGLAKFRSGSYEIVITDYGMTDVNGKEVAHEVKTLRPSVAVIILTGWPSPSNQQRVHEGPSPDFVLKKPATIELLAEALRRVTVRLPLSGR